MLASGALASAAVRSSDGCTTSARSASCARDDAGGRRHSRGVDVLDLVGVFEDVAELARVELDFGLVEAKMRECSNRFDLRS